MKNKKALDKARELAKTIVESKEYIELKRAEEAFHNDSEASKLLADYNKKLAEFNKRKSNKDKEIVKKYHKEITEMKKGIDNSITITNLYKCQKDYDNLISDINNIINYFTGNHNKSKCGSCSGCKG